MTIAESLIAWLGTFQSDRMDTDILRPGDIRYALAKEPTQNVKSYLSGRKEYTDHYTILARLPTANSEECTDNNAYGEELTSWVKKQDRDAVYPQIEGAVVKHIDISTPFCIKAIQEQDSIYQMTIKVKYEKEM